MRKYVPHVLLCGVIYMIMNAQYKDAKRLANVIEILQKHQEILATIADNGTPEQIVALTRLGYDFEFKKIVKDM